MPATRALTSDEIREVGESLYGSAWQGAMAKGLGVPRQSVSYYMKSGGVNGAQAAGIIGLLARMVLSEGRSALDRQRVADDRAAGLHALLSRLEAG